MFRHCFNIVESELLMGFSKCFVSLLHYKFISQHLNKIMLSPVLVSMEINFLQTVS